MNRSFQAILLLTLASVALLAATKIVDPDTMQYLAGGKYTVSHGLESGCVFNYSSDQCQIVYPQWLFHVIAYGIHAVAGWSGLVVLQVAIAVVVFGLIALRHARQHVHPLLSAAMLLLAALAARERFMLRADFFALVPAVLVYLLLERLWDDDPRPSRRNVLVLLGAVCALWANTHGSFPIAFVIAAAFLAEVAAGRRGPLRPWRAPAATIVLASLVNPFGLKSFLQPFQFLLGGAGTAPQLEFLSPFAPADLQHTTIVAYKVLLAVSVAIVIAAFRATRIREILVLAALGYLSITGVRYIALFAVFAALILGRPAEDLRERIARALARARPDRPGRATAVAASVVLVAAVALVGYASATNRLYRYDAISRRTGFGLSDLVYPMAAAEFIEKNRLPGVMFNDYSIGTYLNWRLFPARKTYIDGHSYTPERLAAYQRLMAGATSYQDVVDRFGVGYFVLSHKSSETRDLIVKLYHDERWALVYFDEIAMIFLKRAAENEDLIARARVDLAAFGASGPPPLANIVHPEDFYLGHTDRGLALSTLGLQAPATAELEEAARENPQSFVTATALALALEQKGDAARALDACKRAVACRPGYAPARFWLGLLELRRRHPDEGIAQISAALRINSRLPLAHFNLGAAYENRGDKLRALEEYRKELELNPAYAPAQRALKRLS